MNEWKHVMSKAKCAYFEGRYKAPHPIYSNARVEGGGAGNRVNKWKGGEDDSSRGTGWVYGGEGWKQFKVTKIIN